MDGEFTPDNSSLVESVTRDRATIAEAKAYHSAPNMPRPQNNPYVGNPAAIEAQERYLDDLLIRAGVNPASLVESPADRVMRAHEQKWTPPALSESTQTLIDDAAERIEAMPGPAQANLAAELQKELGPERYAEMVAAAKGYLSAEDWRPAIACSKPLLELISAYARYNAQRDRERASLDATLRRS